MPLDEKVFFPTSSEIFTYSGLEELRDLFDDYQDHQWHDKAFQKRKFEIFDALTVKKKVQMMLTMRLPEITGTFTKSGSHFPKTNTIISRKAKIGNKKFKLTKFHFGVIQSFFPAASSKMDMKYLRTNYVEPLIDSVFKDEDFSEVFMFSCSFCDEEQTKKGDWEEQVESSINKGLFGPIENMTKFLINKENISLQEKVQLFYDKDTVKPYRGIGLGNIGLEFYAIYGKIDLSNTGLFLIPDFAIGSGVATELGDLPFNLNAIVEFKKLGTPIGEIYDTMNMLIRQQNLEFLVKVKKYAPTYNGRTLGESEAINDEIYNNLHEYLLFNFIEFGNDVYGSESQEDSLQLSRATIRDLVELFLMLTKLSTTAVAAGLQRFILTNGRHYLFGEIDSEFQVYRYQSQMPLFLGCRCCILEHSEPFIRLYVLAFCAPTFEFNNKQELRKNSSGLLKKISLWIVELSKKKGKTRAIGSAGSGSTSSGRGTLSTLSTSNTEDTVLTSLESIHSGDEPLHEYQLPSETTRLKNSGPLQDIPEFNEFEDDQLITSMKIFQIEEESKPLVVDIVKFQFESFVQLEKLVIESVKIGRDQKSQVVVIALLSLIDSFPDENISCVPRGEGILKIYDPLFSYDAEGVISPELIFHQNYNDSLAACFQEIKAYGALLNIANTILPKIYAYGSLCDISMPTYGLYNRYRGPCILMERIKGQDLSKIEIDPGLFNKVVDAFSLLHQSNVIHGDISKRNVFMTEDRQIKIVDLGCSKITKDPILFAQEMKAVYRCFGEGLATL